MNSLERMCLKQISNSKVYNLEGKITTNCYEKIIEYQMKQGFNDWKKKICLLYTSPSPRD